MKIRNLLILGLVLMGFTYCSSDDVLDGPTTGNETEGASGVKMQVVVNMPAGATARSATEGTGDGNDGATGNQDGTKEENKVQRILLSIFDSSGKYVANYSSSAFTPQESTAGAITYKTEIITANALKVGESYKVYVYLNPYNQMDIKAHNPNESFVAWGKSNTSGWTTDEQFFESAINGFATGVTGFFMSNASKVEKQEVKSTAKDIGTPFTITTNVERAAARIDYKAVNDENKYLISGEEVDAVSVQFTDYKLLNVSRAFYHLKRVSNDNITDGEYGGAETKENYVVDTDWEAKKLENADEWHENFFFHLGNPNGLGKYTSLKADKTYNLLSYVTENTLPNGVQSKKGLATAVVFKGKLVFDQAKYGGAVADAGSGADVYVWNNTFYGIYANLPAGVRSLVGETVDKANLEKAGVTSYKYDTELKCYPVYYVYYNKHNDNGVPTTTGPMEFATVRNNVYKLSITSVNRFGHSNDPQEGPEAGNADPNPEMPKDDIERDNIYMEVKAKVLPWTVRTNKIEF